MKLLDLLRTIIAWPFLAVAWVFYKVYSFVDPYVAWELEYYSDIFEFFEIEDDEDCC